MTRELKVIFAVGFYVRSTEAASESCEQMDFVQNRDRGTITRPPLPHHPSHTTVHAGPHTPVRVELGVASWAFD